LLDNIGEECIDVLRYEFDELPPNRNFGQTTYYDKKKKCLEKLVKLLADKGFTVKDVDILQEAIEDYFIESEKKFD
jgi:hypothetical protein